MILRALDQTRGRGWAFRAGYFASAGAVVVAALAHSAVEFLLLAALFGTVIAVKDGTVTIGEAGVAVVAVAVIWVHGYATCAVRRWLRTEPTTPEERTSP